MPDASMDYGFGGAGDSSGARGRTSGALEHLGLIRCVSDNLANCIVEGLALLALDSEVTSDPNHGVARRKETERGRADYSSDRRQGGKGPGSQRESRVAAMVEERGNPVADSDDRLDKSANRESQDQLVTTATALLKAKELAEELRRVIESAEQLLEEERRGRR